MNTLYALIITILLAAGCSTSQPKTPTIHDDVVNSQWPRTVLLLAEGVNEGWTEADDAQVEVSRKRCRQLFGDNSCLRKLTKVGIMRYTAVCRSL
jgi:hypothetical protein